MSCVCDQDTQEDFWCHRESPLVHPVGWSQSCGHKLHASSGTNICAAQTFKMTWLRDCRVVLLRKPVIIESTCDFQTTGPSLTRSSWMTNTKRTTAVRTCSPRSDIVQVFVSQLFMPFAFELETGCQCRVSVCYTAWRDASRSSRNDISSGNETGGHWSSQFILHMRGNCAKGILSNRELGNETTSCLVTMVPSCLASQCDYCAQSKLEYQMHECCNCYRRCWRTITWWLALMAPLLRTAVTGSVTTPRRRASSLLVFVKLTTLTWRLQEASEENSSGAIIWSKPGQQPLQWSSSRR